MIELRRATLADAADILHVVRDAYARWVPVMGREPIPIQTDYAKAVQRHRIDLHHVDGALAALIEMHPAQDHLLIVNIAVAPAFQGRGLGGALLDHAERVAAGLGLGEVRLYTNVLRAENIALYLARGYRKEREEAFMGGVVTHMTKRLTPPTAT